VRVCGARHTLRAMIFLRPLGAGRMYSDLYVARAEGKLPCGSRATPAAVCAAGCYSRRLVRAAPNSAPRCYRPGVL